MSVIAAQMPLMAFIGDMQTTGQNNLSNENPGDFLNQILNEESIEKPIFDFGQILVAGQMPIAYGPDAQQQAVPISEMLENLRLVNEIQNQAAAAQPKPDRQTHESTSEQSIVYLLHWLASGHLSHLASDLSPPGTALAHLPNSFEGTAKTGFSDGLLRETLSGVAPFEGNDLLLKQVEISPSDVDAAEQESRRRAADPAIFHEQISPYLKRRLIVSSQEDHTHIILRDYFLESEDHVSELKNLLVNIKKNVSDNIKVTINGHHYGDVRNYK